MLPILTTKRSPQAERENRRWRRIRWFGFALSAALHGFLLFAIATGLLSPAPRPEVEGLTEPQRALQMIFMPPPTPASKRPPPPPDPSREPPAPPPPPAPPEKEEILGPNSKRPDETPHEASPEKPGGEEGEQERTETKPPEAVKPKARMIESAAEALRRANSFNYLMPAYHDPAEDSKDNAVNASNAPPVPSTSTAVMGERLGPSASDGREWRPSFPEAAGHCVDIPDLGKNSDGTPVLATVIGRVLQHGSPRPLAGAHLQIVGTTFTTFSDDDGEYVLRFDPKLLARCRTQYVRVTHAGFKAELLLLAIGPKVRSDDVALRQR